LTSRCAAAVGSALELASCKLELLHLGGNMLGDAGAGRIALALQRQSSLVSLDMVGHIPCAQPLRVPHTCPCSRTTASQMRAWRRCVLLCSSTTACRS
jgi:hypothetical protein